MAEQHCYDCKHWKQHTDDIGHPSRYGQCRKNAPQVITVHSLFCTSTKTAFPQTEGSAGCGDFAERSAKPTV